MNYCWMERMNEVKHISDSQWSLSTQNMNLNTNFERQNTDIYKVSVNWQGVY